MKIVNTAIFALSLTLVTIGCSKDNDKAPDPGADPQQYQLKSINYVTFNGTANYSYNTDSTLKEIVYSNGTSGYTVAFEYDNRNVTRIFVNSSLYEHHYNYETED